MQKLSEAISKYIFGRKIRIDIKNAAKNVNKKCAWMNKSEQKCIENEVVAKYWCQSIEIGLQRNWMVKEEIKGWIKQS